MKADTRLFGEIEISDDKIITFPDGMIGFPECKKYTLIYNYEKEKREAITWLQSLDDSEIAFPVIDPLIIKDDYNPVVNDEALSGLGEFNDDNFLVFVTLTASEDVKKISINLRAPIVINTDTLKASQVILDDTSFPVKFYIYDILQKRKEEAEAEGKA